MVSRRRFLSSSAAAGAGLAIGSLVASSARAGEGTRPNILWIFGDDLGVELGCYGCKQVRTPNLDRLAGEGMLYRNAFTTAPVCSASRSALITGMYATSIGAHHHRSHRNDGYKLPEGVKVITDYFRQAGYFTANVTTVAPGVRGTGKTDFNFDAGKVFDGNDWSQRKEDQPFYTQINFAEPHRGTPPDVWARTRKEAKQHVDPASVELPPYLADHPILRKDWAEYLDAIGVLDEKVGRVLKRLEEEGLAENTIVIFMGDNGRCHHRDKQFLYDGGIHVPLIVRWPGRIKAGSVSEDLISGIDVSATSLALAGIERPARMQGRVFFGEQAQTPRECIFAARDRCDETADCIRCVRDKRWKYIRNFMPDRPYTQKNDYKEKSYPAWSLMAKLYAENKLTAAQRAFFEPGRPAEELYDLQSDPHEVKNLASSAEHGETLKRMRARLEQWIAETGDQGEIPETETKA